MFQCEGALTHTRTHMSAVKEQFVKYHTTPFWLSNNNRKKKEWGFFWTPVEGVYGSYVYR